MDTLESIDIGDFLIMSKSAQMDFLKSIDSAALKREHSHLLKKYIALKVLMDVRIKAEEHNPLNMTAQFRKMLAYLGGQWLRLNVYEGRPDIVLSHDEKLESSHLGYHLFHANEIGFVRWKRKFFDIALDPNLNIVTQRVRTQFNSTRRVGAQTDKESSLTWDTLDKQQLKNLYTLINSETRYENTLGYDLISAFMFIATGLISVSSLLPVALLPFAITLNILIYASIFPPALMLVVVEHLIVNPMFRSVSAMLPNQDLVFIEEVASTVSP